MGESCAHDDVGTATGGEVALKERKRTSFWRVAVVDDDPALLEMIREALAAQSRYAVPAVYTSAEEALESISASPPDILLVDYKLPGLSGVDCIRAVQARCPETKILLTTGFLHAIGSEDYSILRKTCGCLLKPFRPAQLLSTLDVIASGSSVWPPEFNTRLASEAHRGLAIPWHPALTRREHEVMLFLCRLESDKEIADQLHLSVSSVRTHIQNIFRKLGVHTRQEALHRVLHLLT